jgi:hypothetical protein
VGHHHATNLGSSTLLLALKLPTNHTPKVHDKKIKRTDSQAGPLMCADQTMLSEYADVL